VQLGSVHLGQARGGDGLIVELPKELVGQGLEVLEEQLVHLLEPAREGPVLQHTQSPDILRGQQVVEGAQPLAQLHVEAPIADGPGDQGISRPLVTCRHHLQVPRAVLFHPAQDDVCTPPVVQGDLEAYPQRPAEAPHAVHYEPHPSLLLRLCCEIAGPK